MIDELLKGLSKAILSHLKRRPLDLVLILLVLVVAFPVWHYVGLESEVKATFLNRIGLFILIMGIFSVCIFFIRYAMIFFWPDVRDFPVIMNGIHFFSKARHLPFTGYDPSCAKRGKRFVYCSPSRSHDGTDLFIGRFSSFNETLLTSRSEKHAPSFSYDDRYVAFVSKKKLYVAETKPKSAARQISPDGYELTIDTRPSVYAYDWSSRDYKIVCGLRKEGGQNTDVYILDIDKDLDNPEASKNLTLGEIWVTFSSGQKTRDGNVWPRWSPSGRKIGIAFGGGGLYNLWIAEPKNAKLELVTLQNHYQNIHYSEDEDLDEVALNFQSRLEWLTEKEIVFCYGGASMYTVASYRFDGSFSDKTQRGYYFDPLPNRSTGKLLYFKHFERSEAILMDKMGKHHMKLLEILGPLRKSKFGSQYAWHPSGKCIVSAICEDIYLIKIPRSLRLYINSLRVIKNDDTSETQENIKR